MSRFAALFIAVALVLPASVSAKEHRGPTDMELFRAKLTVLKSDGVIGRQASAQLRRLSDVQKEIDRGTKLLHKRPFRLYVISVAMKKVHKYDCRVGDERQALAYDFFDKNGIAWAGYADTTLFPSTASVQSYSLESGDLYPFVQAFDSVPVEHFDPGVKRDIWTSLNTVRAQQYIARTAILLDAKGATHAAILASPLFAWQIWQTLQWVAPDCAAAYMPIDTSQIFWRDVPTTAHADSVKKK